MHQQYSAGMVSITIRNVPQETRNELAARAARGGCSLQEYLRGELIGLAERPDHADLIDRLRVRVDRDGSVLSAEQVLAAVHAERR
jgi:plasmid stability protein